jgi:hypothetical protein
MRGFAGGILVAVVGLTVVSDPAPAEDEVVGAVWSMRMKNKQGDWVEVVKFRATLDGKVFHEGKQVGTHTSKGEDIEIVIDKVRPRLNGTYTFMKVRKDAKFWAGTLKRSDGSEEPARIVLLKD